MCSLSETAETLTICTHSPLCVVLLVYLVVVFTLILVKYCYLTCEIAVLLYTHRRLEAQLARREYLQVLPACLSWPLWIHRPWL